MCDQILENATIKLEIGRKVMEEDCSRLHSLKMTATISSIPMFFLLYDSDISSRSGRGGGCLSLSHDLAGL